ncbi:MAG: hypothetical protein WC346_10065 [Methanogenium sp.]|jgi:hypothetical protein
MNNWRQILSWEEKPITIPEGGISKYFSSPGAKDAVVNVIKIQGSNVYWVMVKYNPYLEYGLVEEQVGRFYNLVKAKQFADEYAIKNNYARARV